MPFDYRLDRGQEHPVANCSDVVIGIEAQYRLLNIIHAFVQQLGFAVEHARFSYRWRRYSLRDSWEAIASTNSFDQSRSKLVYLGCDGAGGAITAQRWSFGIRFRDVSVVLMGGGNDDGAQQVDHVGVSSACGWLEQGYMGGKTDVRRHPSASEVSNKQRGRAIVTQPSSPRKSRFLSGDRVDEPLQPLLLGRPARYRAGSCAGCC